MKIGIFGGAFDPIHLGHKRIIEEACSLLDLDKLLVIPTKHNPWKDTSVASDNQRVEMINITMRDCKKCIVSTIELDSDDEKNYTINTIYRLKDIYPDDDLYFIMGMDQASKFHLWKDANKIADLVQLVAFYREGYEVNDNLIRFNFKLIETTASNESSTSFRQGNKEVVDHDVFIYACRNGLYLEPFVEKYMSKKRFEHTCSVALLAKEFALCNGLDGTKAYIAGMLHDIAKEMDRELEDELMNKLFPQFVDKPRAIYHQWLSMFLAKRDFYIEDEEILQAIENHTTASVNMSKLDMCVYCADKLDPLRGYDSSKQIKLCKEDILEGFKGELINFYQFSKKKNREIDECFYDIYKTFCRGDING